MPPKGKGKGGNAANSATTNPDEAAIDKLLTSVFGKKEPARSEVDLSDPKSILETLVPALTYLCDKVNRLEKLLSERGEGGEEGEEVGEGENSSNSLHQRIRIQEDELDEARQRSLKGNIILTSSNKGGRPCVIKDDATLQREKTRLLDHAIQLVAQKYGVTVPVDDVVACHRLKNSILLKIWRRTEDSAWSKLMSQIKSASTNDFNLYANFQMTPRRGALLYHIRQQRSTFASKGQFFKLYSDENGAISVRFAERSEKLKLTFHYLRGKRMKTFTEKEILNLFEAQLDSK